MMLNRTCKQIKTRYRVRDNETDKNKDEEIDTNTTTRKKIQRR